MNRSLRSTLIFFVGMVALWYWLISRPAGPDPIVDHRLQPALNEWKAAMDSMGISVKKDLNRLRSITVSVEAESEWIGTANRLDNTIKISEKVFQRGPYAVKAALYHELGHYVFNLNHTEHFGIMYYKSYDEEVYQSNWEEMTSYYYSSCKSEYGKFKFN